MTVTSVVKVEVDNVEKYINAPVIFTVFEVCVVLLKKYIKIPDIVKFVNRLMMDVNTPNQEILKVVEGYLNTAKPKMFATETTFEIKVGRFKER